MAIDNVKKLRNNFIKVLETETFQTFSTLKTQWSNVLSHWYFLTVELNEMSRDTRGKRSGIIVTV